MTYSEKLKDPRWQKLRLQVFERDKWKCCDCGASDKTLHAHHAFYIKGLDPWEYNTNIIMSLCDKCHDRRHKFTEIISSYSGLIRVDLFELLAETVFLARVLYNSGNPDAAKDGLKKAISVFKEKTNPDSFKEVHGEL